MQQRRCTQSSSMVKATNNQLQCTFKSTMVYFALPHLPSRFDAHSLQDVAHVLPILFPFTTPGKYCYRAMALFVKHVTTAPRGPFRPNAVLIPSGVTLTTDPGFSASPSQLTPTTEVQSPHLPRPKPRRSLTSGLSRAVSHLKRRASSSAVQKPRGIVATLGDSSASTLSYLPPKSPNQSDESVGVAGQRKDGRSETDSGGISVAGEAKVYAYDWVIFQNFKLLAQLPLILNSRPVTDIKA